MRQHVRAWVFLSAATMAACGSGESGGLGIFSRVGAPCDVGVTVTDPKVLAVNAAAPECPTRMCILPAQQKTTDTKAFCTAPCTSDDDCAGGQRGVVGDSSDFRCAQGFVCRQLVPNLASNPLSCKAVCVCKDFLLTDDPNVKSPTCP